MNPNHSFHIPVLGIGYSADTPVKVAQFGIDSVISLVDDILLEKLRKVYCEKFEIPYKEISEKIDDFRAKRITSYLNTVNKIVEKKIADLKKSALEKSNELKEYFSLLPETSTLKKEIWNMIPESSKIKEDFKKFIDKYFNFSEIKEKIIDSITPGSIDVNIMTKVDKDNYKNNEKLPAEFNDAHAALRGFANSDLKSSVILSAGMNTALYGYIEKFDDFFPDENGRINKKIILKVSDFKSAIIQGKYLAKKGLWVSEYRIESGLNCGGHSFATDGFLLGPVLNEFKTKREELSNTVYEILTKNLAEKNKPVPKNKLSIKITAQGGVGTSEEHNFLLRHYNLDSVGWGTPFLLVPEAVNVDEETIKLLENAKESDLFLSNISPLGVPFNTVRNNTKNDERLELIKKGKPGSACPKKYVGLNFEFTEKGICTASRQYQKLKIKQLESKNLSDEQYKTEFDKIVDKTCICVGLGTSALKINNLNTKAEGAGISVCPGPNMAYFSKKMSLKQIVDHIYGRTNVISRTDRPNMFIKELNIYIDYIENKIKEHPKPIKNKALSAFNNFIKNLHSGIEYYTELFSDTDFFKQNSKIINQLGYGKLKLNKISEQYLTQKII